MRKETRMNGAQEENEELDVSGMLLDSLPIPSLKLASITKLDLSNNNLESIPESLMARLLKLEVMDVHSNQLRVLPNSIGCLSKLKVLNISGNLLESLPRTIEDCRALEELIANFNQLTVLPDTMGFELTNLQKLSINSNKLSFLPSSTSHMTSLQVLDAHLNHLRSLPAGLENLINLHSLNVSQNFHHLRSLPDSIGLLVSLTDLDVSYNTITVLPNSISSLSQLRNFNAEGNPLVRPPVEVVQRGLVDVQKFLGARMNKTVKGKGPSWVRKLAKRATFSGPTIPRERLDESETFLSSEFRSFDGTPKHVGMFSPRRLFSPRRSAQSSPMK